MMPPRMLTPRVAFPFPFISSTSKTTLGLRHASILGSLSDTKGAYNRAIRRGRGPSSGKGKTSGRGHKGQKQHGKVPAGFQGGQTPLEVVHGKRGFENQFSVDMTKVNLDRVQSWIDQGRLDTTKPITVREMHRSRLTHGIKDGVKLLARNANELRTPIHITVSRASASAIAAVEAVGGTVQTRYYTSASIRRILQGKTHPTLSLLSQPPPTLPKTSAQSSTILTLPTVSDTAAPTPSFTTDLQNPNATVVGPMEAFDDPSAAAQSALLSSIRSYRYRLPDPAKRKDLEYYRDRAHRGYLAYQLREGQGPSLFFRAPAEAAVGGVAGGKRRVKSAGAKGKGENRIW